MEQQPHIDVLLDRVFKGTATPAEQRLVREWLFALDLSDAAERDGDMTAAKIAMLKRIVGAEQEHAERETVKTTAPRGRFYVLKRLTRAAALLAGIVLLGNLLLHFISGERQPSNALAEEWVTIHATDNIQYITLPDKSRIWLNAHSELRYSKSSFKVSNRHIWLKGEAFFEVERDISKPFIVHADAIVTRVLGTGFNVTAYQQDDAIRVTLVHGKVSVKTPRYAFLIINTRDILLVRCDDTIK